MGLHPPRRLHPRLPRRLRPLPSRLPTPSLRLPAVGASLPDRTPRQGGRWRDHPQVIDAIAFKYRTGMPWMDLPERFASWKEARNRLRMWAADGTWEKVFTALLAQADAEGDLDWVVAIDSTVVRAHQHAAGGPSKEAPPGEPHDHALGRSRGGLTTKIHLAADSRCRPLAFVITPGQAGDAPAFPQIMARLRVPRPIGRPRTTPEAILADKAYSSPAIRSHLRQRGIRAVIPQPSGQLANRKRLGPQRSSLEGKAAPLGVLGLGDQRGGRAVRGQWRAK
ncbi:MULTISPECIES: IS5 family transposase [unclassified Streptomyces]|uniref:IS5 family transposase n=1 Tax=unclassified Streptomyces TaxID=2593676 RepID=UPI00336AA200